MAVAHLSGDALSALSAAFSPSPGGGAVVNQALVGVLPPLQSKGLFPFGGGLAEMSQHL